MILHNRHLNLTAGVTNHASERWEERFTGDMEAWFKEALPLGPLSRKGTRLANGETTFVLEINEWQQWAIVTVLPTTFARADLDAFYLGSSRKNYYRMRRNRSREKRRWTDD